MPRSQLPAPIAHRGARDLARARAAEELRLRVRPAQGAERRGIVDHVAPLCLGGADRPFNMQWLSRDQARVKDPVDISRCAAFRRGSRDRAQAVR